MLQIDLSVPHDSFPAEAGERVRITLHGIEGLDMIEALVVAIIEGCGTTDQVVLRYDETLLPEGIEKLSRCNIWGFLELCDCCSARPCVEVFAPTEIVENITRLVMILPGPFRLDAVKFYSPTADPAVYDENIVDENDETVIDENNEVMTT